MKTFPYYHLDVFTDRPFYGNGLTVFTEAKDFSKTAMLTLTQEMRQFESIFMETLGASQVRAHIFTCQEELDFAGHPVLGAAALLHDLHKREQATAAWEFILNKKTVSVITEITGLNYRATMNQGKALFGNVLNGEQTRWLLDSIGLTPDDLYPGCYPAIVSTGLPYLIVPLQSNGLQAKIGIRDLQEKIRRWGAMFIGILEIPTLTIRTWDNQGLAEDIATGSLAGPSGAYLVSRGFRQPNSVISFKQGENLGRVSRLDVEVTADSREPGDIYVSGGVCKVAQSLLLAAEYL